MSYHLYRLARCVSDCGGEEAAAGLERGGVFSLYIYMVNGERMEKHNTVTPRGYG